MGVRAALARAAAGADVPVFVARGVGAGGVDAILRASPAVSVVDSPRSATVLVVAGRVPDEMAEALDHVHDQMAQPRATVWWTGGPPEDVARRWPDATVVGPAGDVAAAVVDVHRAVVVGSRPTDAPRLPDVEPVEWRGVGPYGQGGKAMTGGAPYGRPMAGRGDDRDGLSLDVVPVTVGPFFPLFPAGLELKVTFAGDVVNAVDVTAWRMPGGGVGERLRDDTLDAFGAAAAGRPVAVADLEVARARHHLRWLAGFLHLYGLDAIGRRALAAAGSVTPGAAGDIEALVRRLDRPWVLGRATAGVGVMRGDDAASWGGPVARAAGRRADARGHSAAYGRLGFEPVTFAGGDVGDRWRQRMAETVQALELAGRAGDLAVDAGEPVEWPSPPALDDLATSVPPLLTGLEWGDAVATLASLDLALDTPAAVPVAAPA